MGKIPSGPSSLEDPNVNTIVLIIAAGVLFTLVWNLWGPTDEWRTSCDCLTCKRAELEEAKRGRDNLQ